MGLMLCNVNVESAAKFGVGFSALAQRLVRKGKAGMKPKSRRYILALVSDPQKAHILVNSSLRFVRPIAICDLVTQYGPRTRLLNSVRDGVQTAINGIGASMMVDQCRCAVFDRIYKGHQRAQPNIIQR